MTKKKTDLDLRRKIAQLDGWTELRQVNTNEESSLAGRKDEIANRDLRFLPEYELSLDAIAEACDRHNVGFDLKGWVDDKEGYKYSASYSGDDIAIVGGIGSTRAIALCNLFIAVMEERSRQKERAMERDCLGRKIAEEALKFASQNPDPEQIRSNLDLRQKVATLVGWTDFYKGERQQGLWGVPPLGASTTDTMVPRYELDTAPIIGALISSSISYERLTLCDHIDVPDKNLVYIDRNTSITACGKTPAIALCNLFIAVMEPRLAEKDLSFTVGGARVEYTSKDDRKTLIREELVKIETPFTRSLLKQIREKASFTSEYERHSTKPSAVWIRAYDDLVIAADRLDAMLARKEWAKNEYGGTEKE